MKGHFVRIEINKIPFLGPGELFIGDQIMKFDVDLIACFQFPFRNLHITRLTMI